MNKHGLSIKILPAILLAFSTAAMGQAAAPPIPHSAPEPAVVRQPLSVFRSEQLGFSLTYPASLIASKLPSPEEQHAEIAKRQPPDEAPELRQVDQCTDKALFAERKDDPDKAAVNITIFGDKRGTQLSAAPTVHATLLVARVGVDCMPAEYRQQLDAVTSAMAEGSAQGDDLKPIDQPIWYEIGKTRIHFAAAQSVLLKSPAAGKADSQPGNGQQRRWVASIAFLQNGNVVSIYAESNDLPFLNEILHGTLKLGDETAAPLFPADLGSGTPIQPKS